MNKKCPFCGSEPEVVERTHILKTNTPSHAQSIELIGIVEYGYDNRRKSYNYKQTQYMIRCSNKKCIAYQIVKKFWNKEDAYNDWDKREGKWNFIRNYNNVSTNHDGGYDMKYSEMNERQKKAFKNIMYAAQWRIGELENIMMDFSEDTEEYQMAEELLHNHDSLVCEIYAMAITNVYNEGSEYFGPQAEQILKDVRFCGKEWLMERVDRRVTKEGY